MKKINLQACRCGGTWRVVEVRTGDNGEDVVDLASCNMCDRTMDICMKRKWEGELLRDVTQNYAGAVSTVSEDMVGGGQEHTLLQRALNNIKKGPMSKYYVIRYRNAPNIKGCDAYLNHDYGRFQLVGHADKAAKFKAREDAERWLVGNPTTLVASNVSKIPADREAYLMADIAAVEEVHRVTVGGA